MAACYSTIFTPSMAQRATNQAALANLADRLELEKAKTTKVKEEVVGNEGVDSDAEEDVVSAASSVFLELHSSFPGDPGCWGVFLLNLLRSISHQLLLFNEESF